MKNINIVSGTKIINKNSGKSGCILGTSTRSDGKLIYKVQWEKSVSCILAENCLFSDDSNSVNLDCNTQLQNENNKTSDEIKQALSDALELIQSIPWPDDRQEEILQKVYNYESLLFDDKDFDPLGVDCLHCGKRVSLKYDKIDDVFRCSNCDKIYIDECDLPTLLTSSEHLKPAYKLLSDTLKTFDAFEVICPHCNEISLNNYYSIHFDRSKIFCTSESCYYEILEEKNLFRFNNFPSVKYFLYSHFDISHRASEFIKPESKILNFSRFNDNNPFFTLELTKSEYLQLAS